MSACVAGLSETLVEVPLVSVLRCVEFLCLRVLLGYQKL